MNDGRPRRAACRLRWPKQWPAGPRVLLARAPLRPTTSGARLFRVRPSPGGALLWRADGLAYWGASEMEKCCDNYCRSSVTSIHSCRRPARSMAVAPLSHALSGRARAPSESALKALNFANDSSGGAAKPRRQQQVATASRLTTQRGIKARRATGKMARPNAPPGGGGEQVGRAQLVCALALTRARSLASDNLRLLSLATAATCPPRWPLPPPAGVAAAPISYFAARSAQEHLPRARPLVAAAPPWAGSSVTAGPLAARHQVWPAAEFDAASGRAA